LYETYTPPSFDSISYQEEISVQQVKPPQQSLSRLLGWWMLRHIVSIKSLEESGIQRHNTELHHQQYKW